jgi:mono/diheme cytochrome c family protein
VRRTRKIAALVALAVVAVAVAALLGVLRHGFSARDEPTRVEAWAAHAMRRWSVPASLRRATNPVPQTPQVLADARAHWADHCSSCHGSDGKGSTEIGRHLYPPAPDMTRRATQERSDGELYATIENGVRLTGMPGWGDGSAASAYGSWSLVHLIRRLPTLGPEEVAEIEALEPKSPAEWEEERAEQGFLQGEDANDGLAVPPAGTHEHH